MVKINENFLKLQDSYLFSTIASKVSDYKEQNPDSKIIRLGIGDVTLPMMKSVRDAINLANNEMGSSETFKGYGPEQGYDFLRNKIVEFEYTNRGMDIEADEIFVSDGSKPDCSNIIDLFSIDNKVGLPDPVYPVYLDTNVIAGRSGNFNTETKKYENISYLTGNSKNNFCPSADDVTENLDLIYLCSPNNPTGEVLTKDELKKWVKYAKTNGSVILFDAAYERFITDESLPRSIYEIEGAKEVAIEFRSFSKTAGFTGLRCAYTVVPKELIIDNVSLNKLWNRRQTTKFNGVSYVIQKGAEAVYSTEGLKEVNDNVNYYLNNAKVIKSSLDEMGFTTFGGTNAPYIWLKTPNNMLSWEFFDKLLNEANVVGTPGSGFGPAGEGYFRFSSFGNMEDIIEAMERIKNLKF
ncbi:MAG: LL-diaminopimelate aminotransferase [bacterium]